MNIVEQNWDQILNKMKLEYCSSNISYTTWIAPLTVYEVKDNTVYILVKLKASLEHIQDKYLLPFKVCIAEVTGTEYEVEFVTDSPKVIKEKKVHRKNFSIHLTTFMCQENRLSSPVISLRRTLRHWKPDFAHVLSGV